MQDSLKYLTENYCKTHHSDRTNSEVSVIDTQYRVLENQHQENTLSLPLLHRGIQVDCYEADQEADPAWTERIVLTFISSLN